MQSALACLLVGIFVAARTLAAQAQCGLHGDYPAQGGMNESGEEEGDQMHGWALQKVYANPRESFKGVASLKIMFTGVFWPSYTRYLLSVLTCG